MFFPLILNEYSIDLGLNFIYPLKADSTLCLLVITICFVAPFQCSESRNADYDINNISLNNYSSLFWAYFSCDNEYPVSLYSFCEGNWHLCHKYSSFQSFLDSFGRINTCYIRLFNACKPYKEPYNLLIKASKRHIFIQSYPIPSYPTYIPSSPSCFVNNVIVSINNRLSRINSAIRFQSQQTILLYDSPASLARTPASQFRYPYMSAKGRRAVALKHARVSYLRNHTPTSFLFIDSSFLDSYDLNHLNSSPTAEVKAAYIEELSCFLHKISKKFHLQPLISIHPRSSLDLYRASFPDFCVTQGDTFEILPTVSFALGHWPSTAMDVLYANIPYYTIINPILSSLVSDSLHGSINFVQSLESVFAVPILDFSSCAMSTSIENLYQYHGNHHSVTRHSKDIHKYFYSNLDCQSISSILPNIPSYLYL